MSLAFGVLKIRKPELPPETPALNDLRFVCRERAVRLFRNLGGEAAILSFVNSVFKKRSCDWPLSVLDLGAQTGAISSTLLRWSERASRAVQLSLVEPDALFYKRASAQMPRAVLCSSVSWDDLAGRFPLDVDVIINAGFFSRVPESLQVVLLRRLALSARRGFCLVDWARDVRPYLLMKMASCCFKEGLCQYDLPSIIRAASTKAEVKKILHKAGLGDAHVHETIAGLLVVRWEKVLAVKPVPVKAVPGTGSRLVPGTAFTGTAFQSF